MKRSLFALAALAIVPQLSSAATLFESGTLGPTGIFINDIGGGTEPGGAVVSNLVFNGVRFELTQPAVTSRVGGHFVADPPRGTSFFGAIVRLDNEMDFPNSDDLSTPDVLGATLLTFPNPSSEVFGELAVRLDPGWYALIFGSGLFGATGRGGALLNNPDIGTPDYIGHQPGFGWYDYSGLPGPFQNFRLVVEGNVVPEPSSIATVLVAVAFLLRLFRATR